MLTVLRENDFVREFELDGESILDSKYRTCELPFRANYFISRWEAADDALRADMLKALRQFPHKFDVEADLIHRFLSAKDKSIADRARELMDEQREDPGPLLSRLMIEIAFDTVDRGDAAYTCVGECRWFRVMHSIGDVDIRFKAEMKEHRPSKAELVAFVESLPEGLFRWGAERVVPFMDLNVEIYVG